MDHLTYFKIENFKRFDSLEMDGIGQFNLILGDNNVGKTSVLEALLFDEDQERFSWNMGAVIFYFRKFTNFRGSYFDYFLNRNNSINKPKEICFSFCTSAKASKESMRLYFAEESRRWLLEDKHSYSEFPKLGIVPSEIEEFHVNEYAYPPVVPYIPFGQGYDENLINFYSEHIQISKSLKKSLVESLRVLIPGIENIEVSTALSSQPVLLIVQSDTDAVLPLAIFGEGTIKLFRILSEIVKNRGRRLMIDEIDAGIHFRRMKPFWKTILKAAKDNEVQLFITTHDEECLRHFKEALHDADMEPLQADARCFTLEELPGGQVKAYNIGFEAFQHALEHHIELRGGQA